MRVLLSGGGTAGHINPGVAIAKYIKKKNPKAEIVFVGTQKGLEAELIPREGFELKTIKVKGFKRKLSVDTFISIKELFQGLYEARKVVKEFKPDIVIGTGGYVCGPVLFHAAISGIPTLIHEQNAFPGVTNRILAKFVKAVAISFQESEKFFGNGKKLTLTGNPIRNEIITVNRQEERKKMGIKGKLVVVFGGSRGAENVNRVVKKMILAHQDKIDFKIIFATGNAQFEKIYQGMEGLDKEKIEVVPYIYNMASVMAAADLVVSRAGAITIAEITALGVPSVLIPSPYVTANHQEHNARSLEKQDASVVVLEKDLESEMLFLQIKNLLQDQASLKKLAENAKRLGITDATDKIYQIIEKIMNTKEG